KALRLEIPTGSRGDTPRNRRSRRQDLRARSDPEATPGERDLEGRRQPQVEMSGNARARPRLQTQGREEARRRRAFGEAAALSGEQPELGDRAEQEKMIAAPPERAIG